MIPSRLTARFSQLALLAVAFFCVSPARTLAADETPAGHLVFTVDVPAGKSLQDVHDLVVGVAVSREWVVKQDLPGRVVVYLNHRKQEATVTFLITDNEVRTFCDGYTTDGKGNRKGPVEPTRWLNYLKADITSRVSGIAAKK